MKRYIEKSLTYTEYLKLIDDLLAEGKTTGENQSEMMFGFGKLNRHRMKRLEKTVKINDSLKAKAQSVNRKMIWLTITEGWCGDAAQNIPIIEKIAAENPEKIETRYVLRDENPALTDAYLTNGARSIPKLIGLDAETYEVLGTWGPRAQEAMDYFHQMKADGLEKPEMMENLQRWYLENDEQAIQTEFEHLFESWSANFSSQKASANK